MIRPWLFLLVVAGGVAIDLLTKSAAFESVAEYARHEVVQDLFYIAPTRNPGAMWSNFQDVPAWAWVAIRGGIALGLFVYYLKHQRVGLWVHLAFAFVLAGAAGNLHDNIFAQGGQVRDFILVIIPVVDYTWPTFNVADSLICVGAILLLLHFMRAEEPARRQGSAERAPAKTGEG